MTNGYFGWWVTGNKEIDGQNLRKSADEFKINHTEVYNKIAFDSAKIRLVSQKEFLGMTHEKQSFILAHPQEFKIIENTK